MLTRFENILFSAQARGAPPQSYDECSRVGNQLETTHGATRCDCDQWSLDMARPGLLEVGTHTMASPLVSRGTDALCHLPSIFENLD